jgi:hypothetical protein|eukprot:COSAG06_NODE_25_length_32611_cov_10.451160_12_plen_195_part_00
MTGDTVLPVLPVMQPPPRCSRSAQPSLLIARADPDPDNLRGACWLQSWVETATRTCLWAACGLPATTALPAAGALLRCALLVALCARALLQQPHPCSGSAQSSMPSGDASDRYHTRAMAGGVLCVPGAVAVQSDREHVTTRACVGRGSGQSLWNETGQTAVKSSSMLPWGHSGPSDSHHKALLVCFNLAFLWPV